MKPLDLMELMTELPDEYIESAAEPIAAHRAFRLRYVLSAIAACLAIAVLAAIYPKLRVEQPGRVDFSGSNSASTAATDTTLSPEASEAETTATTIPQNGGMETELTDAGGSSAATFTTMTTANATENTVSAAVTTTDIAEVTTPLVTVSRPVQNIITTASPPTIPAPETLTTSEDERPVTAYIETVRLTVTRRPLSALGLPGGSPESPNEGSEPPNAGSEPPQQATAPPPPEAELLYRGSRYYLSITLPDACRYATVTDASLKRESGELSVIVMHSEYDASCEPFRIEIELPQTIFQEIKSIEVTELLRSNFDPKDELTLTIY